MGSAAIYDTDHLEFSKLIYLFTLLQNLKLDKINLLYSSWTSLKTHSNTRWTSNRLSIIDMGISTNMRISKMLEEIQLRWKYSSKPDKWKNELYDGSILSKVLRKINNDCGMVNTEECELCLCGTLKDKNEYNKYGKIFIVDSLDITSTNILDSIKKWKTKTPSSSLLTSNSSQRRPRAPRMPLGWRYGTPRR